MEQAKVQNLALTAARSRLLALDMVYGAASGHIGGSLSSLDILTTLYFHVMRVNPDAPQAPERDRFVLSKGHCTPALYSTLAQRGFFPLEELKQFRRIEGHMSGHAEMRHVKGVDMSTGSLALAGKADGRDYRVYALLGDGEIEEGQVWEAAMAAAKYRLDNLCAVVDVNGLQIDGATADVMPSEPLDQKFEAFNWNVIRVDGHDYAALAEAFAAAAACKGKPTVLLARTVKGKGVSFMEGDYGWHGKAPNAEQYEKARAELAALRQCCDVHGLFLYLDGARLGSALTSPENDLTLPELAALTDVFTIGGTKNGTLFGEAVIMTVPCAHFRWHMKQRGGMLAKGRLLGVQFLTILKDNLYFDIARHANEMAFRLRDGFLALGYQFPVPSPSNQQFPVMKVRTAEKLAAMGFEFQVERPIDEEHTMYRFVTSWATPESAVDDLLNALAQCQ